LVADRSVVVAFGIGIQRSITDSRVESTDSVPHERTATKGTVGQSISVAHERLSTHGRVGIAKSDTAGTPQFGLVAEDVARIDPKLVVRDDKGEIYSVRYDAVNAMLLNEFLKEHNAAVEEQQKVKNLEATVASLVATVKEQAAQIRKVNGQVELRKGASQTVANK